MEEYNMRNINIESLHSVQLSILKEFDRVCKDNNIEYFLAYGTLLGAIRHNGFIPWDDDIDVFIKYDDYKKLQNLPSSVWKKPFFLQTTETDPDYNKCYLKLRKSDTTFIVEDVAKYNINHGVDIDIYPILNLSSDLHKRNRQYKETMLYMLINANTPPVNHGKIFYLGGKIILTIIPPKIKKIIKARLLESISSVKDSKYSYSICGNIEVMRQVFLNDWFSEVCMHQFEDGMFPIPVGADKWLESRYGKNYMKLPSKDQQGVKFDDIVYVDLYNSYKKYKGVYYCVEGTKRKVRNNRIYDYSNNN